MAESEIVLPLAKKPRLKFIDMARSIAILLMLEGHFIGLSLGQEYRDPDNFVYMCWNFVRGFTAPMFFTVTGVIFVYLLSAKNEGFLSNKRVTKGFKRSGELLFWGFFLQLNFIESGKTIFNSIFGDATLDFGTWVYAFHVLQCIGVGIACLLLIYGLRQLIGFGHLHWYYLIFALAIYTFYPYLKDLERIAAVDHQTHYFPQNAPMVIQNMFRGEYSVFPIIPWVGFTLFGGMVGSIIRTYEEYVTTVWFPMIFIVFGIMANVFGYEWFQTLDHWFGLDHYLVVNNVLICRLGQILGVLGILMYIDKHFNINSELFLKIGQNTLPVYVVHVIILYGGIIGYGLNLFIEKQLHPWVAIAGAVTFISSFIIMVKYLEPLEQGYARVMSYILPWRWKKRNQS